MAAKVEIYGTSFCRHCLAARELLDSKDIEYTEYLIDLMPLERDAMLRRCKRKKVPQILINESCMRWMPVANWSDYWDWFKKT